MEFNIKLTLEQLNIVVATLAKGPYEVVADTLHLIKQQGQKQIDEAQQVTKEE